MSKICCQIAVKARNVSNTNRLKPLVEVLEQSRGSSKLLGMPKGGLARACLLALTDVLHVLVSSRSCPPGCVVVCRYPPALLSGFAVNLILDGVVSSLSSHPRGS